MSSLDQFLPSSNWGRGNGAVLVTNYYEKLQTLTWSSAITISIKDAPLYKATAVSNTTFTISATGSNLQAGYVASFSLELVNGGTYVITWPASVKWPSGTAPTLTASGTDVLTFYTSDAGTTWRGALTMKDSR